MEKSNQPISKDSGKKPVDGKVKLIPDHAAAKARQPFIMVAVGQQGVGKSRENQVIIHKTVEGDPVRKIASRRALIFDANDEYTYLKAIHPRDIGLFAASKIIEARRIRPYKDGGQPMSTTDLSNVLAQILESYRNGLLVVEDISRYVSDTMRQDLIGSLVNVRHKNLDVIISLQGIGRITPKLWQNVRWLRMHKVQEAVARHSKKYEEKLLYLTIAENIINNKFETPVSEGGNPYIFLNIDCQSGKMYGKYTPVDFTNACIEYINSYRRITIEPLMLQRDLGSGSLKYTETQAFKLLISKYTKAYSQFSTANS
jgi:hypothetical protein